MTRNRSVFRPPHLGRRLNVVFEIRLVILDGAIADENFTNLARKPNRDGLIFAKFAVVVVELSEAENVFGNLIHAGIAVLNINAERLRNF